MVTRGFIEKIRAYFDELGIDGQEGISFDDFEKTAIKTLNRAKDLSDAKMVIFCYQYCEKHWHNIEIMFDKHLDKWQEYTFEGASNVNVVDDEDAQGVYVITNALEKNPKMVFITSTSYDDELYAFSHKNGKFGFEDGNYYLKYAKTNAGKMKLFDKNDRVLCNIVLSDTNDIFLENNYTNFELVIQNLSDDEDAPNTFVGVFNRLYIESLDDDDYIDSNYMIADIEWDLVDARKELGVARLTIYKAVDDIEPLLHFAASTFLLFKAFNDWERRDEITSFARNAIIVNHIIKHR